MQLKNLTMSYGTQVLFENINLYISDTEKVGVVGVNGAGKSTFFKILNKEIIPDEGKILFKSGTRITYLPQVIEDDLSSFNINVFDYLMSARPIEKLQNELQECYQKLGNSSNEEVNNIYKKIEKIENKLKYWDSYEADSILLKIINGMKISNELLYKKVFELSGGEKSKIAFAKLLYSKPEVILLDEPTNHLDRDSREYVINYLKNYKGMVLVISHDIDFLNQVTNKTLFIDKRTKNFILYNGNYDYYKKVSKEREDNLIRQKEKQDIEEEKLRNIINKYANSSGKRKKMAQDREKKLEKLLENKIELTPKIKETKLDMKINRESGNIPIKVDNLTFGYSNKSIINNLSFSLSKGEKFLIVGANGVGKSTLLKLIMGILTPKEGNIQIDKKTDIGYYAQEHEILNNSKSIIDNFSDIDISERKLRNILGRFLFYGDDVYKLVKVLSPGERSRVALAKLSLTGANMLILDEPTNHLDPETQKIIADVFKDYTGTMLVVSHNPEFVDNLGVERILLLPEGKIIYYDKEIIQKYYDLNTKTR